MSRDEEGIKEEVKVSNLFSNLGYFTRTHIQLYPKEGKITDIDVLCIKFDNHLMFHQNIVEVKRSNDSYSAIFQLYGLKTYFKNCDAFFVNDKINTRTLKVTKDLGIKAYSFKTLEKITEKDKKLDSIYLEISHIQKIVENLSKIKKEITPDLFWGYNNLWLERNPYLRLFKIQSLFKMTEEYYDASPEEEALLWMRKELFMLGFISVYEIASDCIELDPSVIEWYVEDNYYNLGTPKEKKIQLQEGIEKLLTIVKEKGGINSDIKFELLPEWIPLLSKCVKKIISNARYAQRYLLRNETVFRSFLVGNPIKIREIGKSKVVIDILTTMNTDVLKILHKQHIKPDFSNFV